MCFFFFAAKIDETIVTPKSFIEALEKTPICTDNSLVFLKHLQNIYYLLAVRDTLPFLQTSIPWVLKGVFLKKRLNLFKFANENIVKQSKKSTNKKWFNFVSYAFFKVCFTSTEQNKQYLMFQNTKKLNNLKLNQMPSYNQLKLKSPEKTYWFHVNK